MTNDSNAAKHDTYRPAIQSEGEEVANSITHLIGFVLSVTGLFALMIAAARRGNAWHITGAAIFGSSLIILYLFSTIYHIIHVRHARAKRFFRFMDHIGIYLLIAGTYSAVTLTFLRGPLGWTLFGIEWGFVLFGIMFKILFGHKADGISTLGYVIMGWLIVVATYPIVTGFPHGGIMWLVLGGLAYTLGVPFYFLDERKKYFHAIWHVFVMTGSICHFFMVLWYIIPQ